MRKSLIFLLFCIICNIVFSQSACSGVIVGERTTITNAQKYLEYLSDASIGGEYKKLFAPITDTFEIIDICIVDSLVVVQVGDINNSFFYTDVTLFKDVTVRFPNGIFILSKKKYEL